MVTVKEPELVVMYSNDCFKPPFACNWCYVQSQTIAHIKSALQLLPPTATVARREVKRSAFQCLFQPDYGFKVMTTKRTFFRCLK